MPRKPKDCGCGGGEQCITKRGKAEPPKTITETPQFKEAAALQKELYDSGDVAGAKRVGEELLRTIETQAQQALAGAGRREAFADAKTMLDLYLKEHKGKVTKGGAALKKDMMKFVEAKLKEWDCGCGCQGMKKLRQLRGGALKDCPPGYSAESDLICISDCPPGMRGDMGACRGCPPGYTDMGLSCFTTNGSWWAGDWDSQQQTVIDRDRMGRVDWDQTGADIQKGLDEFFGEGGELERAFDPEQNGVAQAFREFGEDTEAAFQQLGEEIKQKFDESLAKTKKDFEDFGDAFMATVGNDEWWRETMTNPRTYIFIIGSIASVAAMVLSGGTASPLIIAALGALGPSMNMIADAAEGKEIDPIDIAGLLLAVVPAGASAIKNATTAVKPLSSGIPATEKAFLELVKSASLADDVGVAGAQATKATSKLGQLLAQATTAAKNAASGAIKTAKAAPKAWFMGQTQWIRDLTTLGRNVYAVTRNPKLILQALQLSPRLAASAKFVPWSQLTKAGKAVRALKNGVFVLRQGVNAANLGLTIAANGEVVGLWELPDAAKRAGRWIRLTSKVSNVADDVANTIEQTEGGQYVDASKSALDAARDTRDLFADIEDANEDPMTVDWDAVEAGDKDVTLVQGALNEDTEAEREDVDTAFEVERRKFIETYGVTPEEVVYMPEDELIRVGTEGKWGDIQRVFVLAGKVSRYRDANQGFVGNPRYDPGPHYLNATLPPPKKVPGFDDLSRMTDVGTLTAEERKVVDATQGKTEDGFKAKYGISVEDVFMNHLETQPYYVRDYDGIKQYWEDVPGADPEVFWQDFEDAMRNTEGLAESLVARKYPPPEPEPAVDPDPTGPPPKTNREHYQETYYGTPEVHKAFVDANPYTDFSQYAWYGPMLQTLSNPDAPYTGSGRHHKKSLVELNMNGTGFPEDLAYMGIDMSPLEGAGVPHKSWEAWYDKTQHENRQRKMDMVKRRVAQRTVKILPYTERPALLTDTFKVNAGRDIHGQIQGGGKKAQRFSKALPGSLQTTDKKAERAVKRMAKAARQALKKAKAGTLQGGDWFSPSTWSWESVNPVNWSTEDWSNLGKGVDAAVFGALSQPEVLGAADAALTAGGGLTIPGVGHVAGKVLGQLLVGAVLAHEYVYPSCEKGEGVLGCNEYRKEVDEVIRAGLDIYKKVEGAEKAVEGLTNWLDTTGMIEAGDVLGSGAYRGAFTRGERQAGETEEKFYYPATAQREARGVAEAGGEYAGPQAVREAAVPQVAPPAMTLSRVQAF